MSPGPHTVTPPPRPCQTCSPGPEEVSSPASAMGIDTGPPAHGSSRTPALGGRESHRGCSQRSQHGKGSPGHPWEEVGTWGHHGAQSQHGPVPAKQGPVLVSEYSHPGASCPRGPRGRMSNPAGPTAPSTAPLSPFGDTQDLLHFLVLLHDLGPCCGA